MGLEVSSRSEGTGAGQSTSGLNLIQFLEAVTPNHNNTFKPHDRSITVSVQAFGTALAANGIDLKFTKDSVNPNLWHVESTGSYEGKGFRLEGIRFDVDLTPTVTGLNFSKNEFTDILANDLPAKLKIIYPFTEDNTYYLIKPKSQDEVILKTSLRKDDAIEFIRSGTPFNLLGFSGAYLSLHLNGGDSGSSFGRQMVFSLVSPVSIADNNPIRNFEVTLTRTPLSELAFNEFCEHLNPCANLNTLQSIYHASVINQITRLQTTFPGLVFTFNQDSKNPKVWHASTTGTLSIDAHTVRGITFSVDLGAFESARLYNSESPHNDLSILKSLDEIMGSITDTQTSKKPANVFQSLLTNIAMQELVKHLQPAGIDGLPTVKFNNKAEGTTTFDLNSATLCDLKNLRIFVSC